MGCMITYKACFNTMVKKQFVPAELHGQGSVEFSPAYIWFQVIPANDSLSQVWSPGKTKNSDVFERTCKYYVTAMNHWFNAK